MTSHADILDQPESLSRPFWGSVILHVLAVAALVLATAAEQAAHIQMGSPTGGGIGSVMVNPVASIPLPSQSGPKNPVANDTESAVPEPKPKAKTQPKVKVPEPDAIPLNSRNAAKKRPAEAASRPNKWREQQKDLPNQTYSAAGQRANTPMYGMSGGGGVGIGDNSPFGTQFGEYATRLRDLVAQKWKTGDLYNQAAPPVAVMFTIRRDGSVSNVKVAETSGNRALDFSAMRAIQDAAPFPALPPQFPQSQADLTLRFQLRH